MKWIHLHDKHAQNRKWGKQLSLQLIDHIPIYYAYSYYTQNNIYLVNNIYLAVRNILPLRSI